MELMRYTVLYGEGAWWAWELNRLWNGFFANFTRIPISLKSYGLTNHFENYGNTNEKLKISFLFLTASTLRFLSIFIHSRMAKQLQRILSGLEENFEIFHFMPQIPPAGMGLCKTAEYKYPSLCA